MKVNILILQSFWIWDHFKVTDFLFVWETLQNLKHIGGEDWKPFVISHFGTTVVQEQTRNTLQGSVAKALQDVSSSFLDYPYIFFFFSSLEGNQNSIRALYMPEILLSTSKYMAVVLAINCRVYFFFSIPKCLELVCDQAYSRTLPSTLYFSLWRSNSALGKIGCRLFPTWDVEALFKFWFKSTIWVLVRFV